MLQHVIGDLSNEVWLRTNATDVTSTSFPTKIPTTTSPSGDGVIPFGHQGAFCPRWLHLIPIGTGADDNTLNMNVLGWRAVKQANKVNLWVPVLLTSYAVTLGSATGVANSAVDNTYFFADTITSTGGPTFITSGAAPIVEGWFQISPAGNAIGMISQASLGFRYLEVIFNTNSSATACNALYCKR